MFKIATVVIAIYFAVLNRSFSVHPRLANYKYRRYPFREDVFNRAGQLFAKNHRQKSTFYKSMPSLKDSHLHLLRALRNRKYNLFNKPTIGNKFDRGVQSFISRKKYADGMQQHMKGIDRLRNLLARESLGKNVRAYFHGVKNQSNLFNKSDSKRGVDVSISMHLTTTGKPIYGFAKLEDIMAKALQHTFMNTSMCPGCEEEEVPVKRIIQPAYECDEWVSTTRLCILQRNIGDTVTFYLSIGVHREPQFNVSWSKELHRLNSKTTKEIIIDPGNTPENLVVGRRGYELRISPITETDLGKNLFTARLKGHTSFFSKVSFMIRIVPIDLGFVYVGESIELNLRSFGSFPTLSMNFKWYMEKDGEYGTLPSNMKVSASGSCLKISELRQEQQGILACSVYTNKQFLATRRRFHLKDLVKNNYVLKASPNESMLFEESVDRFKRYPQSVYKRSEMEDMNEVIGKALLEPTTSPTTAVPTIVMGEGEVSDNFEHLSDGKSDLDFDIGHQEPEVNTFNGVQPIADYGAETFKEVDQNVENQGAIPSRQLDIAVDNDFVDLQESMNQARPGEKTTKRIMDIPQMTNAPQTQSSYKVAENGNQQYIGVGLQSTRSTNYRLQASKFPLKIGSRIRRRRVTADEMIAKVISSCYSDLECSENAICVRKYVKSPGFCKCLPGFPGIGIFCREAVLRSSNFELNNLRYLDATPSNESPTIM